MFFLMSANKKSIEVGVKTRGGGEWEALTCLISWLAAMGQMNLSPALCASLPPHSELSKLEENTNFECILPGR